MSYNLDALITARAMAFGAANPGISEALVWIFDRECALTTAPYGLRRVGLPSPECVVPAVSVALGVLASMAQGTPVDAWSEDMTDRLMIAAMTGRNRVRAEVQADRETHDSLLRTSYDPTDVSNDVIMGSLSNPWQDSSLGNGAMHNASVSYRPDTITRESAQDMAADALDVALDMGADPVIVDAIMAPEFGDRVREGLKPIMRAAKLPESGRNAAKSRARVIDTQTILAEAGSVVIAHNTVNPQAGRRSLWTDEARTLATVSPENLTYEARTHDVGSGYRGHGVTVPEVYPVTTVTPDAWVAPALINREANGPAGRTHKINAALFIQESKAGIKFPSRRRKAAGQTGPTVPERLTVPVETVVVPSPRADFDALIARTR